MSARSFTDDDAPVVINIGNVSDGAMVEAFELELRKVLANIYDLNTPATATRTIQEGAVSRGNVEVPNRLALAPYRTFREIDPVESDFLVRMKPVKDSLPTVALLEVDGGKWKLDTIHSIGIWLRANLPPTVPVIA